MSPVQLHTIDSPRGIVLEHGALAAMVPLDKISQYEFKTELDFPKEFRLTGYKFSHGLKLTIQMGLFGSNAMLLLAEFIEGS